jgi:hypothetical protein
MMNRFPKSNLLLFFILFSIWSETVAYPIDGYGLTGIRRLLYLELILKGELPGTASIKGAQKTLDQIKLNLYQTPKGDSLKTLPEIDPILQKSLNALFPNLDESYSISVMDITPGKPIRYAARKEDRGFQPGSEGPHAHRWPRGGLATVWRFIQTPPRRDDPT